MQVANVTSTSERLNRRWQGRCTLYQVYQREGDSHVDWRSRPSGEVTKRY